MFPGLLLFHSVLYQLSNLQLTFNLVCQLECDILVSNLGKKGLVPFEPLEVGSLQKGKVNNF